MKNKSLKITLLFIFGVLFIVFFPKVIFAWECVCDVYSGSSKITIPTTFTQTVKIEKGSNESTSDFEKKVESTACGDNNIESGLKNKCYGKNGMPAPCQKEISNQSFDFAGKTNAYEITFSVKCDFPPLKKIASYTTGATEEEAKTACTTITESERQQQVSRKEARDCRKGEEAAAAKCATDQNCKEDYKCIGPEGFKECAKSCTVKTDCPKGQICAKDGSCIAGCEEDADCGEERKCDPQTKQCKYPTPPTTTEKDSAFIPAGSATLEDPLGNIGLLNLIGKRIIPGLLGVIGAVAVVAIVWGGFSYIISRGNEEEIKTAKSTITYAIIGLFFAIISWILINTIIQTLTK
jgi:hypothetical protein